MRPQSHLLLRAACLHRLHFILSNSSRCSLSLSLSRLPQEQPVYTALILPAPQAVYLHDHNLTCYSSGLFTRPQSYLLLKQLLMTRPQCYLPQEQPVYMELGVTLPAGLSPCTPRQRPKVSDLAIFRPGKCA